MVTFTVVILFLFIVNFFLILGRLVSDEYPRKYTASAGEAATVCVLYLVFIFWGIFLLV